VRRDFVANVSHELKTPLTSIQGFAQAILDGTAGDGAAREHAARVIFDESQRLKRLVEELLDLARLDAGQAALSLASVDLTALLADVVDRMQPPAQEKGVRLSAQVGALPALVADGDRLAQVFTNLIDNAIKHTPAGGEVRVAAEAQAEFISVSVEDSGTGIPVADLERIFERFYQVDRSRRSGPERGAGLGLAISREIVVAHGGAISAESRPGLGSRFTLRLPRARPGDSTAVRRAR
jgi:two-component system sensor histidine kinase ResE